MTRAQAERLVPGRFVIHPATVPPFAPLRITAVATSYAGRPMARLDACGTRWLPLTEYGLPGKDWKWEPHSERWTDKQGKEIPTETLRALMPQLDLLEESA